MLTIGVGLFGALAGFVANSFLAPKKTDPDPTAPCPDDLRLEIAELERHVRGLCERGAAGAPPRRRRDYG